MKIMRVIGREIYDSRGWPTVLCELWFEDGTIFTGYAPSSNAYSKYEAQEIRDGGQRLWGKGVQNAVALLEERVAPLLVGQEVQIPDLDFALIELDGTPNKSLLGSNVLIATSMALYKAYAHQEQVELYELFAYLVGADSVTLPCPLFSIITNAKQGGHRLHIHDYMIAPLGATTLKHAMDISVALYHELKDVLRGKGKFIGISEEGGLTAEFADDREALDMLIESLERIALEDAGTCVIALDASATELYDATQNRYILQHRTFSSEELVNFYSELVQTYPIYSIEDGLSEDDWDGWRLITETLGDKIQVVGNNIFSTNAQRLQTAVENNVATAAVIKPGQIGTITETIQLINLCRSYRLNVLISHCPGETEDSFIADLAVGTSSGQIKAGGCSRSERLSKYNRLLAIEEALMLNRTKF